jgi:hypothetical protein
MSEIVSLGLLLFLIAGYLIYHFRGRPRASDISSLAELRRRIPHTRFTIVQFYAPL